MSEVMVVLGLIRLARELAVLVGLVRAGANTPAVRQSILRVLQETKLSLERFVELNPEDEDAQARLRDVLALLEVLQSSGLNASLIDEALNLVRDVTGWFEDRARAEAGERAEVGAVEVSERIEGGEPGLRAPDGEDGEGI